MFISCKGAYIAKMPHLAPKTFEWAIYGVVMPLRRLSHIEHQMYNHLCFKALYLFVIPTPKIRSL